jgi:hypothetical protein
MSRTRPVGALFSSVLARDAEYAVLDARAYAAVSLAELDGRDHLGPAPGLLHLRDI